MSADNQRHPASAISEFIASAFAKLGVPDADARSVAGLMVKADLYGYDTHGSENRDRLGCTGKGIAAPDPFGRANQGGLLELGKYLTDERKREALKLREIAAAQRRTVHLRTKLQQAVETVLDVATVKTHKLRLD